MAPGEDRTAVEAVRIINFERSGQRRAFVQGFRVLNSRDPFCKWELGTTVCPTWMRYYDPQSSIVVPDDFQEGELLLLGRFYWLVVFSDQDYWGRARVWIEKAIAQRMADQPMKYGPDYSIIRYCQEFPKDMGKTGMLARSMRWADSTKLVCSIESKLRGFSRQDGLPYTIMFKRPPSLLGMG